jgi:hypothetical protein
MVRFLFVMLPLQPLPQPLLLLPLLLGHISNQGRYAMLIDMLLSF